jgi:catechol 2,3-dioxygenase-like lactoylglutathione lyase family enzyme
LFSKAITTISVQDLDASIGFYTRVLGFQVVHRFDDELVHVAAPGMVIALRPRTASYGPAETPHMHIGLMVTDLDATREELEERGVLFIGDSVDAAPVKLAFFSDPDGTSLYLCQWKTWRETRTISPRYQYDLAVI